MSDSPIVGLLRQIAKKTPGERRAHALWQWRILAAEDANDYQPGLLDFLRVNLFLELAGRDNIGHG